jgi:predicted aldo/keto reductase-like oxidoreductase
MQYRRLQRLEIDVSALGFGCMRLPTIDGDEARIDVPHAEKMLRYAIDNGVNYVDTAYPYHGGNSETVVGDFLARDGYRDKVYLATKLPSWSVSSQADCDAVLAEQLRKLKTDHIDFYMLHCVSDRFWRNYKSFDVMSWMERVRDEGKIRYIGFSFHDAYPVFEEIIGAWDWDFCQIQYNYVNENVQAGRRGLMEAAGKNIPVIVMEPLFGGALATPPEAMYRPWRQSGTTRTLVDLALQWLWDQSEVAFLLSGMSDMEQTIQNVESAAASGVGTLTDEEHALVARLQKKFQELSPIPCTRCNYCMPCPSGVAIPTLFELYNNALAMEGTAARQSETLYNLTVDRDQHASNCTECGECVTRCPQNIPITEYLKKIDERFCAIVVTESGVNRNGLLNILLFA